MINFWMWGCWGDRRGCYEFDELNGHPVIPTVSEQFEQLWRKREIVSWIPSCKFADNVDGCRDDTAVFIAETFTKTWPGGP